MKLDDGLDAARGLVNGIIMGSICWIVIIGLALWGTWASATDWGGSDGDQTQVQAQDQSQAQEQGQSQAVSAPTTVTSRETHVGVSMGGLTPQSVTDCYVPKRKMGRGFRFLFGAVEMTAVVELDPACVIEKRAARDDEIRRLEAETARLLAEAELLRAEAVRSEQRRQETCCAEK